MRLEELFDGVVSVSNNAELEITSITHEVDKIEIGACYIMLHCDDEALEQVQKAVKLGANVVVTQCDELEIEDAIVICVSDIRKAYAILSKNFYKASADKLKIIGVVGTNGKSTTSYMIWSIMSACGRKCGFIGTGLYMIGDVRYDNNSTTPDPMELHKILYDMANAGVEIVVMEVSAHSIYLKKIWGLTFEVGVFTNLSQDHLDYFDNMSRLKGVKQSFFIDGYCRQAVINEDDKCGIELIEKLEMPVFTYGLDSSLKYDISTVNIKRANGKTIFDLCSGEENIRVKSNFLGVFNVYNMLSAILTCQKLNVDIDLCCQVIENIQPMSGRANVLEYLGRKYIIDYAHTPIGLKNILLEAKNITSNRLIAVFGAGGDRDRDKRSEMGRLASEVADIVIITSDNPRGEDRVDIMTEVYSGVTKKSAKVYVTDDRRTALYQAQHFSRIGDTIVIAGKGAEEYIEEKGKKYYYNDKKTIEEILGTVWI